MKEKIVVVSEYGIKKRFYMLNRATDFHDGFKIIITIIIIVQ